MKFRELEHRFVRHMPSDLEPGVLYVSLEFGSVMHLCCCGCGQEVVTPLTPTDWKIIFDGKSISLTPSVGNWSSCRAHYWIRENRVIGAEPWSDEQVRIERNRDAVAKAVYYRDQPVADPEQAPLVTQAKPVCERVPNVDESEFATPTRWSRVKSWLASWARR